MDMPGMSGGSGGGMSGSMPSGGMMMMPGGMMAMGFMSGPGTALYSGGWTPMTTGAYAGTCIFIIVLGMLFRAGLALKSRLERHWGAAEADRRYVIRGKAETEADSTTARLVAKDGKTSEDIRLVRPFQKAQVPPWRLSTDFPRAILVTIIAAIGYLLMLAVMAMNVGYFSSVLAGIFVGELAVGRYAAGH